MNSSTRTSAACVCAGLALLMMAGAARADLIGHWKLDDPVAATSVVDSSGNGRTLDQIGINTPTLGDPGVDGTSSGFYNTASESGYWRAAGDVGYAASSYTISFWVKPNNSEFRAVVSTRNNPGGGEGFIFYHTDTDIQFWQWNSNIANWDIQTSANYTTDGSTWHHVVGTYDAATQVKSFYVTAAGDGFDAGAIADSTGLAGYLANDDFAIGGRPDGQFKLGAAEANFSFIDDVQYYSHALSAAHAQLLYQNPGQTIQQLIPTPAALPAGLLLMGAWATRRRGR